MGSEGKDVERFVCAVVDPGSLVSLVRCEYVPVNLRESVPSNGNSFCGINQSPIRVLGTLLKTIEIEGIKVELRFLVVPNDTMSCAMLLGRDFTRNPLIKIELGDTIKVTQRNKHDSTNEIDCVSEIMRIEYQTTPVNVKEELNINTDMGLMIVERVRNLYNSEYVSKWESGGKEPEIEMKISLKNDQPITFRPRRLAYSDTQKLRIILDDLLQSDTIRPSKSPYASPIVLVRKKNGKLRLCVDFRELNKITVKDNFSTSLILLDLLSH